MEARRHQPGAGVSKPFVAHYDTRACVWTGIRMVCDTEFAKHHLAAPASTCVPCMTTAWYLRHRTTQAVPDGHPFHHRDTMDPVNF